jgi:CBS-domain-containing membrane protein
MPTDHLPLSDAGPAVRDAMMFEPRPTSATTTLPQVRETFANPRVKLLLVTDEDGRFLGTLTRDDVPADGDGPIADHVNPDAPRIDPDAPVARAVEMLDGADANRLPVVGDDGVLQGLVCWDRSGQRFCVDPGRVTPT